MKTFGNILWYIFPIPLLGLMWVISMFLGGALWCVTVLGVPLGLGLFQVGKFALAPFNRALITRKEYEMLTGEKQNTVMKGWSLVIRILYIPFGLIWSFMLVTVAIASFVTLVGIPNGLVYIRLIPAVFNPIGKICVPRVVGEEVERMKEHDQLSKYIRKADAAQTSPAAAPVAAATAASCGMVQKAETKSDEELEATFAHRDQYNPDLIAAERVQASQPQTPEAPTAGTPRPNAAGGEWMQKLGKPPYLYGAIGAGAVLLGGIVAILCLCFGGDGYESTDLRAYGLRGKVKDVTTCYYEFTEQSGKVVRGAATNKTDRLEFDKNGYLSLIDGDIIVRYTADGAMASSNYLAKLNRNADGQLADAESMPDLAGDVTFYGWEYDKHGFLSAEVNSTPYSTYRTEYSYDKEGNPVTCLLHSGFDGNSNEFSLDYRYLKFDKEGNWIERIVQSTYGVAMLEVRAITYYKGNEKDGIPPLTVKKEYEGKVGSARVKMSLDVCDFNVRGTYFYTKYNVPLSLIGTQRGNSYLLRETAGDKWNPGAFELCIDPADGSLSGMWAGQGKEYQVKLREVK